MSSAIGFINVANSGLGAVDTTETSYLGSICLFFMQTSQSTGADQILWNMDQNNGGTHALGQQIYYDNTGQTIAFKNQAGSTLTTIKPVLNQWYFVALTQLFLDASNVGHSMYIKPVGAPTCKKFGPTNFPVLGNTFTPAFVSIGNQHVFVGSAIATTPFVGSICGVKYWNNVQLTQEDVERESEQMEPIRTVDLHSYWPLTRNTDIRDATVRSILLVAPNPGNLSQTVGPNLPEVKGRY
jgi:hypothetical protein